MAFYINPTFCTQNPTNPACGAGASTNTGGGTWNAVMPAHSVITPAVPTTTTTPGTVPGQVVTITTPTTPWYKTWWGIGAIVVGGLVGLKALAKNKAG